MKLLGMAGVLLLSPLIPGCRPAPGTADLYFGQDPPGDTPVVFAPGIISKTARFEQFLLYAPDGHEVMFGVTNAEWSAFSILSTTWQDGSWSAPHAASFLGSGDSSALTAALSFDGRVALFTSSRPTYPPADIWMSTRVDAGWTEPTKVGPPISSAADEFEVAIARNGTIYFSSKRDGGLGDLDIYRARLVNGAYPAAENLGPPINTEAGDDLPYIAPDESYLIFASDRPGGLGNRDLYVSFSAGGTWTDPQSLGRPINSEEWDIYPSVSPDGKYFFFTRRTAWHATEDSDIYWVSAAFIERLRRRAHERSTPSSAAR